MKPRRASQHAFTLIEIMVVASIIGLLLLAGIPSIHRMTQKAGMRRAVDDVMTVCQNARARAILSGTEVTVVFRPLDGTFGIGSAAAAEPADPFAERPTRRQIAPPGAGRSVTSGQLPEDVTLEGLGINWFDCTEYESAVLRFFPDGRCDEMTLILRSDKGEWRKFTLEPTTALISWTDQIR